jgi:hypothetical protein
VDGLTDLRGDTTLIRELHQERSRSVDPETVEDWKNYGLLQETEGDIYGIMLRGLVDFSIYNLAKLPLIEHIFAMVV